ncbi:MAG: hypothetical protein KKH02_00640 [Proteobacteria bacterium]|nr:hypothetical protein [Pseudomonadota bacterium]MCG2741148.1 hypothetical protein [Syntrophaceae bacterium]
MENADFGNLRDWGNVLEKMEELSKAGKLGDYQSELVRVLRYNDNWRLREAALEALPGVKRPGAALINEVFTIMMREDLYCDVRILAADALGKTLRKSSKTDRHGSGEADDAVGKVLEGMKHLLDDPQPPILHKALRESVNRILNG